MRGYLIFFLVVIVAVDSVRSQARPPTRTKKGPPPSRRRGDNTDRGLPSGKDVPDGRRMTAAAAPPPRMAGAGAPPPSMAVGIPPTRTRAAAPPAAGGPPPRAGGPPPPAGGPPRRFGGPPPPAGGPPPPAGGPPRRFGGPPPPVGGLPPLAGAPPPPAGGPPPRAGGAPPPAGAPPAGGLPPTRTKSVRGRPNKVFNDNPDFGLPSGRDYPDSRRYVPQVMYRPAPPPPPQPKPQPPQPRTCQSYCNPWLYKPACSYSGNTYDNECYLYCSGEMRKCEGQCPCEPEGGPSPAIYTATDCGCPAEDNPVCVEDNVQLQNSCVADCQGQTIVCSSHCPC